MFKWFKRQLDKIGSPTLDWVQVEVTSHCNGASLRCRENILHACVINVEGEVVPCVLTDPVLCENREPGDRNPPCYIFKGQSFPIRGISFGNIQNESLTHIWNKEEYSGFRETFNPKITRSSEQILSETPQCCVKCYKRLGA